jgi:hypothetical protein
MAVAQRVHGDARGKVQVTSAVRRVEIVALSAFEHDVLATVRRHHSRNHWTLHKRNSPLFDLGSGTDLPRLSGAGTILPGWGVSTWPTAASFEGLVVPLEPLC